MRDTDKLFLVFLALCAVLMWTNSVPDRLEPPEPTTNTLAPASDIIIDLELVADMMEGAKNITIKIEKDQPQNVTIWKGDKVVAYIPRGA